jgi:hypothetical protein
MYILCLTLSLLSLFADLPSAPTVANNDDRIAELVGQLGSSQFKEREAATQQLDRLGLPALKALKTAARSSDPEVHRRAAQLYERIQRRVETAQLLEPKRLRLVYRDMPVTEAVAGIAQKTGFNIQLDDQKMKLVDPAVTLDTGETTFWQAFDKFCLKVGLVEKGAALKSYEAVRAWNARGLQIQPGLVASPYLAPRANIEGRLFLVGGEAGPLPTFYAGSLRIRAIPSGGSNTGKVKGETSFVMEVTPEPKMGWQGLVDLRIDKALDEKGQSLTPMTAWSGDGIAGGINRGNVGVVWEDDLNASTADLRDCIPVRFKSAETSSNILREISGTIAAQIQTPVKELATIENILQSAGRAVKLPESETLKVLEVERDSSGAIRLRLRLEDGLLGIAGGGLRGRMAWGPNGRVVKNWVVLRAGRIQETVDASALHFLLVDAKGQSFRLVGKGSELAAGARGLAQEITLMYRPRQGQAEAARLVYSGRRTVLVEVPFALKNVPLQ